MQKRIYGLDIMRAVAILSVVFYHGNNGRIYDIPLVLPDGVTIFFVLSGFLIGGILIKKNNNLLDFYKRRWLRTLPAYFFIITLLILQSLISTKTDFLYSFLSYYGFMQFFFNQKFFPEAWSLAIEEIFYFLTPIFIYVLLMRFNKKNIIIVMAIVIIILETFFRSYAIFIKNPQTFDSFDKLIRMNLFMRFDSLMFGITAAWFNYYAPFKKINAMFVAGIICFAIALINRNFYGFNKVYVYTDFSLQALGTMLLLPKMSSIKTGKGLIFSFLTYVSLVSYSMYLLNLTPFNKLSELWGNNIHNVYFYLFMYLIWVFGGAYLLYRLIEKPFMNLRDGKINRYKGLNKIDEESDFMAY
jgi:peptidoglycan/LPS O-acetylase OafA/YrhL